MIYIYILALLFIIFLVINKCKKINTFENTNDPVDVVYTWVNSYDPTWLSLKNKHLGLLTSETDNSPNRWINTKQPWDEISISIESVRTYLPWIRNVYVVTQRPQKLPKDITDTLKITHIHHDQIFPDTNILPVFSSHSIESCLHRIPGLAEKFIYFNDDMYITNYLDKADLFFNNMPIGRVFTGVTYKSPLGVGGNIHNSSLLETSKYSGDPMYIPIHEALPVTKEIIKDAEEEFMIPWNNTRKNKFRVKTNIIPLYIAISLGIKKEKVKTIKKDKLRYIFTNGPNNVNIKGIHMACFNNLKENEVEKLREVVFTNK